MKKVSLRELVADKIIFAVLVAIGYCLMGTLVLIEVIRTVAFWLMDEKGL